jgi:hypothetical protein
MLRDLLRDTEDGLLSARAVDLPCKYVIDAEEARRYADELERRRAWYQRRRRAKHEADSVRHVDERYGRASAERLRQRFEEGRGGR